MISISIGFSLYSSEESDECQVTHHLSTHSAMSPHHMRNI